MARQVSFTKVRAHAAVILALTVANVGAAIPFGLDSGPQSSRILPVEWVFSALMAVAALALIARLAGLLKPGLDAWPLALSGGLWTAVACYAGFFEPHAIVRWRIGIGLIFLGLALVFVWLYVRETFGEVDRA